MQRVFRKHQTYATTLHVISCLSCRFSSSSILFLCSLLFFSSCPSSLFLLHQTCDRIHPPTRIPGPPTQTQTHTFWTTLKSQHVRPPPQGGHTSATSPTTTDNHTNTGINKPGFQLPCSSVFCFSKALTAWISSLPDGQDLLAEVMKRIDFNGRPDDFFRLETACALCAWCWDGLEVALRIETKLVWLLHNHRFYSNEQTAVFLATVSSVRVCQHWGCAWLLSS